MGGSSLLKSGQHVYVQFVSNWDCATLCVRPIVPFLRETLHSLRQTRGMRLISPRLRASGNTLSSRKRTGGRHFPTAPLYSLAPGVTFHEYVSFENVRGLLTHDPFILGIPVGNDNADTSACAKLEFDQ